MPNIPKTNLTAEALRAMSEQMGDIEFEMELAPYNNYTGGTDAKDADYEGLFPGAGEFGLRGQFAPPSMTPEQIEDSKKKYWNRDTGKMDYLYGKPGTVQGIAAGATPKVWAHEYRHKNNPDMSEKTVRYLDAVTAPNKRAWDDAVYMYQDSRGGTLEEAENALLARLAKDNHPNWTKGRQYQREIANGAQVPKNMRTENWFMPYSEMDQFKDYANMRKDQTYWAKALRDRNTTKEPTQ